MRVELAVLEPERHEGGLFDPRIAPGHPPGDAAEADDLVPALVEPVELPTARRTGSPIGSAPPARSSFWPDLVPGSTAVGELTYSMSGSVSASTASMSRPFQAARTRWTISTFSCDIAYSDSPAAARAWPAVCLELLTFRTHWPSRKA